MPKKKSIPIASLTNFKHKMCDNVELSDSFINDLLLVSGLETNSDGYIVDDEEGDGRLVFVKNRPLRVANNGILHARDILFDPYNNAMVVEELFRQYIQKFHPTITVTQIFSYDNTVVPTIDTYGYIQILYNNGGIINSGLHYKDSTKYLDAFMRLESMTDTIIIPVLKPYDDYEKELAQNGGFKR